MSNVLRWSETSTPNVNWRCGERMVRDGPLSIHSWELTLIAMAVLFGHCYSVFLQGKGGKAVATSMGVLLAQMPGTAIILACIWLIVRLFTKRHH